MAQESVNTRLAILLVRAWTDKDFRKLFLKNPDTFLAKAGVKLRKGVKYHVVVNTPTKHYLVLPEPPVVRLGTAAIDSGEISPMYCGPGEGGGSIYCDSDDCDDARMPSRKRKKRPTAAKKPAQ